MLSDRWHNENDINGASDAAKNNVEAAGNSLKYTAANFKDDFAKAGYKLKDSANSNEKLLYRKRNRLSSWEMMLLEFMNIILQMI